MANGLISFRADDELRLQATVICNKLGIDLPDYLRICLTRMVNENGIPFSMKLDDEPNAGVRALRRAQKNATESGADQLSLDDVNAEIRATRTVK